MTELELVVIAGERERFGQRLIRERPVSVRVVQIVLAILQEHANRFAWERLPHQRFVVMAALPKRLAVRNVGEAPDPRQHLAELVRAFPGGGERTDSAAARA